MEKALELKPDLIVSDNRMPGLWGSEALRQLLPLLPKAKMILLSADDPNSLDLPWGGVRFVGKDQDYAKEIREALEALQVE